MSLLGEWAITPVLPGQTPSDHPPEGPWKTIDIPEDQTYLTQGKDYKGPLHGLKFDVDASKVRYVWYRKRFVLPTAMQREVEAGRRVFIHFDAVAFVTDAYLNGHHLGQSIDGFLPFEYDVTQLVNVTGENTLELRVGTYQVAQELGAPVGNTFKQHGGIWQPAYLETRGPAYVEDIFVQPSVREKQLKVDLTVGGDKGKVRAVRYILLDDGQPVTEETLPLADALSSSFGFENPTLWWPDSPYLYVLRTELLTADGSVLDSFDQPFGFREVWIEGTGFYLNGKKLHLYGRWTHAPSFYRARLYPPDAEPYFDGRFTMPQGGEYLTPETIWPATQERGGINVVRLHCQPVPKAYLDAADRQGILLIAETAIDHRPRTPEALEHAVNYVKRDRNHPSVVMWSGSNEFYLWMAPQSPPYRQFMAKVRDAMHEVDPTRPVSHSGFGVADENDDVMNYHYPTLMSPQYMPNELFWPLDKDECRRDKIKTYLEDWNQDKPLMLGEVLPPWKIKYATGYGQDYFTLTEQEQLALDLEQKPALYAKVALIYRMLDVMHLGQSIGGSGYVDNPMKQRIAEEAYATVAGLFYPWTRHWYEGKPIRYELWLSNIGLEDFEGEVTFYLKQGGHVLYEERRPLVIDQGGTAKLPVETTVLSGTYKSGVEALLSAQVSGVVGSETVDTYIEQPLRILPKEKPIESLRRKVYVWNDGQDSEAAAALLALIEGASFLQSVRSIGTLDPAVSIVVLPGGLFAKAQTALAKPLAGFVKRGGRVLVLEQDTMPETWLPVGVTLLEDAQNTLFAGTSGGAFSSLPSDALTYWQQDHRVVRKPFAEPLSGPVTVLADFPSTSVIQLRYGEGLYVLSQTLVQEKLGLEPMAREVLKSLLHYLDTVELAPVRTTHLWAGPGSRYAEALDEIGVELKGRSTQVPGPALGEIDQVLIDAATVNLAELVALRKWVRDGGRIVLHDLTDVQIAQVAELLSLPVEAGVPQERVRLLDSPLDRGMSPYLLSFGKKTWPLSASPIEVRSAASENIQPATTPMLLGTAQYGQGEVVFDQVQWDREAGEVTKARRFGVALMNNLGVPMVSLGVAGEKGAPWIPLDLTLFFNAGATMTLPKTSPDGKSVVSILSGQWPRGRQRIDGVDVILPDPVDGEKCLIRLNTRRALPGAERLETFPGGPAKLRIPMRRINAAELAFVHGYLRLWDEPYEPPSPPSTVMTYRVFYDTGRVVDIPVRDGEQIRHLTDGRIGPMPEGKPAFTTEESGGSGSTYYLQRWKNPHPEEKIEALEVVAEQHPAYAPALLSISYRESELAYD